jgi:hypothetical protein
MKAIPAWLDPFLTPRARFAFQAGVEMEIQILSPKFCSACGRKIADDELSRLRNSMLARPDGRAILLASCVCLDCSAGDFWRNRWYR